MNIDCLLNRISTALLMKCRVHKTLYGTADGSWSDCEDEAYLGGPKPCPELDELPWNKRMRSNIQNRKPGVVVHKPLFAHVKYVTYYQIGNRRFEIGEEEEAKAAAFFEYFKVPIMEAFVEGHNRYMKHKKTVDRLLLTTGGSHV